MEPINTPHRVVNTNVVETSLPEAMAQIDPSLTVSREGSSSPSPSAGGAEPVLEQPAEGHFDGSMNIQAIMSEISKEFIEVMSEQRDMNRAARNIQRDLTIKTTKLAVEEMKKAAMVNFAGQVASSAATAAGGAVGMGGSIKASKVASGGGADPAAAQRASQQAMAINSQTASVNQIMQAAGQSTASTSEMIATTEHSATQRNLEAQADLIKTQAEDSNTYFRDSVSIVREAQSSLKEMNTAMSETNSAVIQNIKS